MTTPTKETDARRAELMSKVQSDTISMSDAFTEMRVFSQEKERERNEAREDAKQGWKQAEEYRGLIPTTAQAMVYHSLLMKYKASEAELIKLRKVCDELAEAVMRHAGKPEAGQERKALTNYSTLPHVMLKKGTSK